MESERQSIMVSVKNDPGVHKIWALMECSFLQKAPQATGMVEGEYPEEVRGALVPSIIKNIWVKIW